MKAQKAAQQFGRHAKRKQQEWERFWTSLSNLVLMFVKQILLELLDGFFN
jgi:hypothetical protein